MNDQAWSCINLFYDITKSANLAFAISRLKWKKYFSAFSTALAVPDFNSSCRCHFLQRWRPTTTKMSPHLRDRLQHAVLDNLHPAVRDHLRNRVQDRVRERLHHVLRATVQADLPRGAGQAVLHRLRAGVCQWGADDLRNSLPRWLPECSVTSKKTVVNTIS